MRPFGSCQSPPQRARLYQAQQDNVHYDPQQAPEALCRVAFHQLYPFPWKRQAFYGMPCFADVHYSEALKQTRAAVQQDATCGNWQEHSSGRVRLRARITSVALLLAVIRGLGLRAKAARLKPSRRQCCRKGPSVHVPTRGTRPGKLRCSPANLMQNSAREYNPLQQS